MLAGAAGYEGVVFGLASTLVCTANGANTVAVATGGAMVDGKWYYNDANLDVNIPSAVGAGNTRIDRIVLRANWAGYEVAVTRIAGTDAASPTAPAITQTSGTTYDIPLCRVLVNTAGTVTVTDERVYALPIHTPLSVLGRATNSYGVVGGLTADVDGYVLRRSGTSLGFGTITGAGIANDAIDSQHYAAGSIDLEHMSANSVDSDQYVDNSIDIAHIGTMLPGLLGRQGGDATDWTTTGTTDYTSGQNIRIQVGALTTNGYCTNITFPVAFSGKPLVFAATFSSTPAYGQSITASGCSICAVSGEIDVTVMWLAIGPE